MCEEWQYVPVGFHGEKVCEAWVQDHNRWNGWLKPYVTEQELERFILWWVDNHDNDPEYEGEAESYRSCLVTVYIDGDDLPLYAVGGSLVWEYTPERNVCEEEEYRTIYVYKDENGEEHHLCDQCIEEQELDLPISFKVSSLRCEGSCDF